MKPISLFTACLVACVILMYCSKPRETSPCPEVDTTQINYLSNEAFWDVKVQQFGANKSLNALFVTDPFPPDATAEIMSYLLKQDVSLYNLATTKSIGGIFDAAHFKIMPGMGGVRLWYCYNPHDAKYPEFFLALEQIQKYDSNNVEGGISKELYVAETFLYAGNGVEKDDAESFIRGQQTSPVKNNTITDSQVLEYAKNFKSLMSIISPKPTDAYCEYAVAFFENNAAYEDFMSQNPIYIRYYLGLAIDKEHKPNYLRPVLAGVNATGRAMTRSASGQENGFLQKSVPPPPYNN